VIVRAVVLKDWIFPSTSKTWRAGSVGGAMSTGTQGACAIALTAVNTNRHVINRAGLRAWVINLYFLFEVIILSFLFVFVFYAQGQDWALVDDGQIATCMPEA
jgi:hypothetical protein